MAEPGHVAGMVAIGLGLQVDRPTVEQNHGQVRDRRRPDAEAGAMGVDLGPDREASIATHHAEEPASGCASSAPIRLPTLALVSRSNRPMAMTTNAATASRAVG